MSIITDTATIYSHTENATRFVPQLQEALKVRNALPEVAERRYIDKLIADMNRNQSSSPATASVDNVSSPSRSTSISTSKITSGWSK